MSATDVIRVACSISVASSAMYFFVDTAETYSTTTRYYFELGKGVAGTKIFTLRLQDFVRKDSDSATLESQVSSFPVHLYGAGFTSREPKAHSIVINEVRPLPQLMLPYQPWVVPFTVNLLEGEIIDWRGSPGTGYQGPDLWGWLGEPQGAKVQCDFLRDAQLQWQTDFGELGPFAHCYVWDRPDKSEFGDPDPDIWIYTWHDPNSSWGGYQYRPLEATARLLFERGSDPVYADATSTAAAIVRDYLIWLDEIGWPSLAGPNAGPPTDFKATGVERRYEEPHMGAYVMRAALWGLASGTLSSAAEDAAEALISRAWTYLQDRYVTSGSMEGTWSNNPATQEWYGFWHAEIILTLVLLLDPAPGSGSGASFAAIVDDRGIDLGTVRSMLVKSDQWLDANTRPRAFNDGISIDIKQHSKTETGDPGSGPGQAVILELWHPPAFNLETGWTFAVTAGCKLTAEICHSKFDNILNFQGFNTMPGNDLVLRNVDPSAANRGSSTTTTTSGKG